MKIKTGIERIAMIRHGSNDMYEVGLATAVRPETDMVIVKSDDNEVSFDLLQIRIHKYPKEKLSEARQIFNKLLTGALVARKNAKSLFEKYTWSLLDRDCLSLMLRQGDYKPFGQTDCVSIPELLTIRRLLELGIIRCEYTGGCSYRYAWTDFGKAVTHNPNSPAT